jgi:hypothetical protein
MARNINSFAQFVSANEDLRKYYENARSKQKDSIEETLRMIDLHKSQSEQNIVESETAKQIDSLHQENQEWRGVRDEPESQTNSKIGNTWNYKTDSEPVKQKNKINPNITDL